MEQDERLWQTMDVFLQYGFRKTSMDDIARVLGISRQALYKQYGNKQQLFDAMATHIQGLCLVEAEAVLKDFDQPLKERLVQAIDLDVGQFVDKLRASPHAAEVMQIAEEGEVSRQCQAAFRTTVCNCLAGDPAISSKKHLEDQVDVLCFVIKGLVHSVKTGEEFRAGIRKSLNIIFA